jgi:adenosine kinase
MSVLVCGSIAYDTIMVFNGRFREHILPDRIHMLSVAFLVPELRRNFGGCAGNIGYNARLLGLDARLLAAVGRDFGTYETWLTGLGLNLDHVRTFPDTYTAQAFITTDLDDNQITAFHPGAMQCAHEIAIPQTADITLAIVAPDGREAMVRHAEELASRGTPFIFDPGQGLPMFGGEDLLRFIEQASWLVVNDYEAGLVQERTGLSAEDIAERLRAYIVTRGAKGSRVYTEGTCLEIPAVPAAAVDPTGCGDAYRAGLLYGLSHGHDWPTTGRIASLMGALKVAHRATQTHSFTLAEFRDRFAAAFGYRI